jgi:hypothetical protein
MDAVHLSRITTVLVVGAVGGVAGHTLWPFAANAGAGRAVAFCALMLGTGALRGWREAVIREDPATGRAAALYAAGALALALLGYVLLHGAPFD